MTKLNWRLTPDGMLALTPVVGWEAAVLAGTAVGLQIQFVRSDEQLLRGEFELEQLIMTPAQANDLADLLKRLADKAASPPPTGTPAN